MKKKWLYKRLPALAMSLLLALSLAVSPCPASSASAAEAEYGTTEGALRGASADVDARGAKLVYGDKNLSDEDALVFMIAGDGFTAKEQNKFYDEAAKAANYVMDASPWNEFSDVIKFYAVGTISKDSGARGEDAESEAEANQDKRETFLGAHFWSSGMKRLLTLDEGSDEKLQDVAAEYVGKDIVSYCMVIVNSELYGGTGGDYACTASLNSSALEIVVHEMGHTVGALADEYWANGFDSWYEQAVNTDTQTDETQVKWKDFIGKNGIGIYPILECTSETQWYRPTKKCKMYTLGENVEFCEVCKEQLRKQIMSHVNVTKLFLQTYNNEFYEGDGEAPDLLQYVILRKNGSETKASEDAAVKSRLSIEYYKDGTKLDSAPTTHGDYTAKITYTAADSDTYETVTGDLDYTINYPNIITIDKLDKTYDGNAVDPAGKITVSSPYDDTTKYTQTITYDGTLFKHYSLSYPYYDYDAADESVAPIKPGSYTITVTVKDGDGNIVGQKSRDFDIDFKKTELTNNNDGKYPGATNSYNNQAVSIMGEGYTHDTMEVFEEKAEALKDYILNYEPFKETQTYLNFTSIEMPASQYGGTFYPAGTANIYYTCFGMGYDSSTRKLSPYIYSDYNYTVNYARSISYYEVTSYDPVSIVIVNTSNVYDHGTVSGGYYNEEYKVIYVTDDEAGMEYAARVMLNSLTGRTEDYVAKTDNEKAAQRDKLISMLYNKESGDHPVVTSSAYGEVIAEDGAREKQGDMSGFFHTYAIDPNTAKLVDLKVPYTMTYYADNNGEVGSKLGSAPTTAGTYHACAEVALEPNYSLQGEEVATQVYKFEQDGATYYLTAARGWTTYTIKKTVADADVSLADQAYTGEAIEPEFTVTHGGTTLRKDTDYTVTYSNNTAPGKATATIKGIGEYAGTKKVKFSIAGDFDKAVVTDPEGAQIDSFEAQGYTGKPVKLSFGMMFDGIEMVKGEDYTVSYEDNIDLGTATVTISGIGAYAGKDPKVFTFEIRDNIADAVISEIKAQTYKGSALTPKPTVVYDGKTLEENTDYTLTYSDNTNAGTASVTVKGIGAYAGSVKKTFTIAKASKTIKVGKTSYTKTHGNKAFSLGATISAEGERLSYTSSNPKVASVSNAGRVTLKGPGAATITISSAASTNYKAAAKKVTIVVKPKAAALSSVKSAKKAAVTIKWKKVTGATGYQVYRATKKGGKYTKIASASASKVSYTDKKAKSGKTYYYKVRAYKKLSGGKVLYGGWSAVKSAKVK